MTIFYAVKAVDDLKEIDCQTREAVIKTVDRYAADPEHSGLRVKRIENSRTFYLDMNRCRIMLNIDTDDGGRVEVVGVV